MLSFSLILLLSWFVYATTPTPTATPTKTNTLDNFRKVIQDKVKEKISEGKNNPNQKTAFQGIVKKADLLEIEIDIKGTSKKLILDADATATNGNSKIELSTIKTGQTILALGYPNEDGSLATKRIVLVKSSPTIGKTVLVGQIADISKSSKVILLVPLAEKGKEFQITIDDKTEMISREGKSISYQDLTKSIKILLVTQSIKNSKSLKAIKLIAIDPINPKASPTPTPKVAKRPKTQ